jgi:hypothetical protein
MTAPAEKKHFHPDGVGGRVLMTIAAAWLHFCFLFHAGGLPRDEGQVVNLAG